MDKPNLLVTNSFVKGGLDSLRQYANIYLLDDLDDAALDEVLPSIDCVFVQTWWPDSLTPERVRRMPRLRFVQSGMAGVNHIPFKELGERVTVSSNAGGFSVGVAEYAFALVLAAAKGIVRFDHAVKAGEFKPEDWEKMVHEIMPLRGRTLGILGLGGIGREVASMARAVGMNVIGFSRHPGGDPHVKVYHGSEGMRRVLRMSDAMVISLPLTKLTVGLISGPEFADMKGDAVLVNVARAEIVDEEALYKHLARFPRFTYATDVWQIKRGKESYSSKFPLLKLPNFIGTPHVAGGSSAITGEPGRSATDNLARFLRGEAPRNVVDPSEYI
ncbi:MAG TPA: NAD(P)-dependent oxidoreductase [Nitrososphaerales archaeon]|nr:NAD(P)-dependent oxidoreductase [Nitrososphaerales archaeon]HUK74708.1 NAD(P)-dependent oxidoreductase [Nitrososphaerales archaeon]